LSIQSSIAVKLEIHRDTIHQYKKKSEDFDYIFKKWEDKRNYYFSKTAVFFKLKPALWIFLAKNFLNFTDKEKEVDEESIQIGRMFDALDASIKGLKDKPLNH